MREREGERERDHVLLLLLLLLLQLLRMLLLVVVQVCLGCLLRGVEDAEVVVAAGWCVASSLVPVTVWSHSLEAGDVLVRPDEKVLLHFRQHEAVGGCWWL